MNEKVQLQIEGIAHADDSKAFYVVSLCEVGGERRLPIVIGQSEAQAIAIAYEHMPSPRPNAYDVFSTLGNVYDIEMREVYIHDRRNGVYYASIVMQRDLQTETIDARPSDAIALALRMNAPVFINRQLFDAIAIDPNHDNVHQLECPLNEMDKRQLTILLGEAVRREDYERAAVIRDILKTRI